MQELGQIIRKVLKDRGWENAVDLNRAIAVWAEVVGDRVARNCRAVEIKKNILYVRAKNAAWKSEVSFLKDEILSALNENIKSTQLKDIRFL